MRGLALAMILWLAAALAATATDAMLPPASGPQYPRVEPILEAGHYRQSWFRPWTHN